MAIDLRREKLESNGVGLGGGDWIGWGPCMGWMLSFLKIDLDADNLFFCVVLVPVEAADGRRLDPSSTKPRVVGSGGNVGNVRDVNC